MQEFQLLERPLISKSEIKLRSKEGFPYGLYDLQENKLDDPQIVTSKQLITNRVGPKGKIGNFYMPRIYRLYMLC